MQLLGWSQTFPTPTENLLEAVVLNLRKMENWLPKMLS